MAGLNPSSELLSVIQEILLSHSTLPPPSSSSPSSHSSSPLPSSLFSLDEINLLKFDLENVCVTSNSLKLIQRYLKSNEKKRSLKSIIQGSSLKFPKFVIPTVEVWFPHHIIPPRDPLAPSHMIIITNNN